MGTKKTDVEDWKDGKPCYQEKPFYYLPAGIRISDDYFKELIWRVILIQKSKFKSIRVCVSCGWQVIQIEVGHKKVISQLANRNEKNREILYI